MQITITNPEWLLALLLALAAMLMLLALVAKPLIRYVFTQVFNDAVSKLLTEKYTQNIAELLPSLKRFSVLNAIELSLRAENGTTIGRPLGSPKHYLGFENLMFTPCQMKQVSLFADAQVDVSVTIGPTAKKPLKLEIPLMIGAMAYGLALSEQSKVALAKASRTLGTALCSGEGPILPEEGQEAGKYILQISRWCWGLRTDEQVASADMLEVQMGQGADTGSAWLEAAELAGRPARLAGLKPGEPAQSLPAPPGIEKAADWPAFMENLRDRANGIPIALKLMASDNLEEDIAIAIELGFDAIILDGAQGGSHASPIIKQDDFGIPALHALIRAKRYLANSPISLIIAGGFFTPGQCLKALALGADAIYLATVPLFALVHNQTEKVTPWEPLTTLVFHDSPTHTQLNIDLAATGVVNAFTSMILEMQEGLRAMGKSSLSQLGPGDLVALDTDTARVTGVKYVCDPVKPPPEKAFSRCEKLKARKLHLRQI